MIPIEEEMRGKVAIVTGGNTGIGFGCAKVFCQAGMRVVIAARRKEKGEAAAAELNAMGKGECTFFQCDVSDPDQVKALVEFAVERYGRLDTMVNNAGYNPIHMDACDMSIESYQRVLGTNLMGEFYGCKFAIPYLRKTKGSIINMSSIIGIVGNTTGNSNYAAAKGGVSSLTKVMAVEWAQRGIRVNAIAPGFFATKQNAALLFKPDGSPTPRTGKILAATPMGRFGDTEKELAGLLLFLLNNEAASFITGVCIPIDGGFSAYSGV